MLLKSPGSLLLVAFLLMAGVKSCSFSIHPAKPLHLLPLIGSFLLI